MSRSLNDELEAMARHWKWVDHVTDRKRDPNAPIPSPEFKDCTNCQIVRQMENETERQDLCTRGCPMMGLPCGPSYRLRVALEVVSLPTEAVALLIVDMTYEEAVDVQALRSWQRSRSFGG
jgi:hypothetical protein